MKFDVIIGNPPYQPKNLVGQALWPLFVKLSYNISKNYVALIIPSRWGGHSNNISKNKIRLFDSILKDTLITINMGECSRHFPSIGPNPEDYFSYIVLEKNRRNNKVKFITRNDYFYMNIDNIFAIFTNNLQQIDMKIMKKIDNVRNKKGTFYTCFFSKKHFKSTGQRFYIINYARFNKWNKMEQIYDDGSLTTNISLPTKNSYIIRMNNDWTPEGMRSIFGSKLFTYYQNKFYIDAVCSSNVKNLPFISPTHKWTDTEIYKHFNLTQEEIEYIENEL